MVWSLETSQGNEAAKIRHLIVPFTRGTGLDLGCGPFKAWPHFTGVDNLDEWQELVWEPDVRADVTNLALFADGGVDFVFSSHLLEHLDDTEAALREWWRVIKPGGYLILYLPHADLYPRMGEEGANPDHKHDFEPDQIVRFMEEIGGWDLLWNETRDQDDEYSFLQVFKKGKGNKHEYSHKRELADKRLLVIRYGAYGDQIMASSILPALKDQGYHITYNTTPRGFSVMRHDPHIDEFLMQDIDQVPNEMLSEFWFKLGSGYDRVINLSESVEGTFLALPGRRTHALPKSARHKIMDVNYLEFHHDIAEIPHEFKPKFYATGKEDKDAKEYCQKLGNVPVILWSLAGSSVHKAWPWSEIVVCWLLQKTNAKIVLVGGPECQLLEYAIARSLCDVLLGTPQAENEMKLSEMLLALKEYFGGQNRLICQSGAWEMRESMALTRHVDIVVGPETGLLNACGFEETPKVCILSHSTVENLTKHWRNTIALIPTGVDCYPCHRMHYDRKFCPEDELTGASACAAWIKPEMVFEAVCQLLPGRLLVQTQPQAAD